MGFSSPQQYLYNSDGTVFPSALLVFNAAGMIVYSNARTLDMVSLSIDEVVGVEIQTFLKRILHAKDYERARVWLDDPFSIDSRLIYLFDGTGDRIPVEISIYCVPGVESVLLVRDIFAYSQLQKQSQRLRRVRLISDLAEETADKVINPLTSLKGFIQMYENTREEFPWDLLVQELDNIERAVQEVLVFSHNYMGQPDRINFNQALYEVFTSVEAVAQRRGIWIESYLDNRLGVIKANRHRISTLLSNLILYALNTTGSGGVLTIETRRENEIVILELVCGLDRERIDQPPAGIISPGDTDLNLVICEHLVESLGGSIHIKSREKAETAVIVTIPRHAK